MASELVNIAEEILHKFTSFHYDTLNHFLYVGDDAGILYTFDIENGHMASAIIAHNNEITQISFVESLNSIVTQSLEEMRFWRIGQISPELRDEVTKAIEKDYYLNVKQDDDSLKKGGSKAKTSKQGILKREKKKNADLKQNGHERSAIKSDAQDNKPEDVKRLEQDYQSVTSDGEIIIRRPQKLP